MKNKVMKFTTVFILLVVIVALSLMTFADAQAKAPGEELWPQARETDENVPSGRSRFSLLQQVSATDENETQDKPTSQVTEEEIWDDPDCGVSGEFQLEGSTGENCQYDPWNDTTDGIYDWFDPNEEFPCDGRTSGCEEE
jgi:hypothetical protein